MSSVDCEAIKALAIDALNEKPESSDPILSVDLRELSPTLTPLDIAVVSATVAAVVVAEASVGAAKLNEGIWGFTLSCSVLVFGLDRKLLNDGVACGCAACGCAGVWLRKRVRSALKLSRFHVYGGSLVSIGIITSLRRFLASICSCRWRRRTITLMAIDIAMILVQATGARHVFP